MQLVDGFMDNHSADEVDGWLGAESLDVPEIKFVGAGKIGVYGCGA